MRWLTRPSVVFTPLSLLSALLVTLPPDPSAPGLSAAGALPVDRAADAAAPFPFGDRLIDIDLSLGNSAIDSLLTASDVDAPGRARISANGSPADAFDVSVHVKGGKGSRRGLTEKPSLRVAFPRGTNFAGLESLTLNNMVQDHTMVHEALGYALYRAAGVPVPWSGYARLTINGTAYGLYSNVETIDQRFLERVFGDGTGVLYEGSYGVDVRLADVDRFEKHAGDDPGRRLLLALARSVEAPGDGVFYGPAALIEPSPFLAMMAAAAVAHDADGYYRANNYRLYWIPSRRRWAIIPGGTDQMFGAVETPLFGARNVLFAKCRASARCMREYASAVRGVLAIFERLDLPRRVDALLRLVDGPSRADTRRPYSLADMAAAREQLRGWLRARPAAVRRELREGPARASTASHPEHR